MKITLINPAHTAIGSRVPKEHLPPLGLLSIGGPLLDHGYDVDLIDADRELLSNRNIVTRIQALKPDVVMIGHSGSSSVHKT
jgi:anaerobic magnesium-protoporphyrin IX monomethyl ester cyclase